MYVMLTVCIWCLWKPKEGIGFPGPGATSSFELSHESWELNPGPLEEQRVLLTRAITTAPNLDSTLKHHIIKQDKVKTSRQWDKPIKLCSILLTIWRDLH